ncbi:MAG: ATP-binding cassette domain-containing protein [Oscillospiraceae bacterium]|nr:ATP-binding cassette domain-containing protein [Oscillospiraceae bacterium]
MRTSAFLEFDNISKMFGAGSVNETEVFEGFSLSVKKGQFVSIVGSNGSGKTTLLNLLCGSLPPDGGEIRLDGKSLNPLKEFERARYIGRVFQAPDKGTSPALTVLENLSLADNKGGFFGLSPAVDKRRVAAYKEKLELLHLGLENRTDQLVGTLSGGQRQALALLMCTMKPVELLVLDEHTAALDPSSSENVMELTERLVKELKVTTLMVTHNLRYAVEHGSRLLMLHEGRSVVDIADEEKSAAEVGDLLKIFNEISVECGN